jgi:hypothetical protein
VETAGHWRAAGGGFTNRYSNQCSCTVCSVEKPAADRLVGRVCSRTLHRAMASMYRAILVRWSGLQDAFQVLSPIFHRSLLRTSPTTNHRKGLVTIISMRWLPVDKHSSGQGQKRTGLAAHSPSISIAAPFSKLKTRETLSSDSILYRGLCAHAGKCEPNAGSDAGAEKPAGPCKERCAIAASATMGSCEVALPSCTAVLL